MARIRTIKPEFCTSEQIGECSTSARLLFVTSWCFFDDGGNHPFSVMQLKAECFPYDTFTRDDMLTLVRELVDVGLYRIYEAEGKLWLNVSGWHHQKIDRPSIKYPEPEEFLSREEIKHAFDDYSTSTRRVFDEDSSRATPRSLPESTVPESTVPSLSQADARDDARSESDYPEWFEQLWSTYPTRNKRRAGKRKAFDACRKLKLAADHQLRKQFGQAVAAYRHHCDSTDTLARDMHRFVEADFWRDFLTSPVTTPPTPRARPDPKVERVNQIAGLVQAARKRGLGQDWIEQHIHRPERDGLTIDEIRRGIGRALANATQEVA